ncbi:MAG: hypothetical protein NT013_27450 [Planctomycetia bacterium]|nr:hypothetical protein [Planctomycetia bacterium]
MLATLVCRHLAQIHNARWSADISLKSTTRELIVRATDSRGETQPQMPRWNAEGYLFNGWHRVPVKAS